MAHKDGCFIVKTFFITPNGAQQTVCELIDLRELIQIVEARAYRESVIELRISRQGTGANGKFQPRRHR